ncbi:MAG: hypothetical protein HY241_06845 [Actinobacteria bacterium]|nr:hypothetical protein [Actinomycetota bacterium]
MTSTSTRTLRGPLLLLGALAALLIAAGTLPWLTGGTGPARALGTPLAALGLVAGFAVLRAARPARVAVPVRSGRCASCSCGAGGAGACATDQP